MTSPRPNQGANQRQKSPRCSRATVFSITRHFDGGHGCDLERTSSKRLGGPNEFKAARSTDLFDWRPIASRKVGDKAVTHWLAIGGESPSRKRRRRHAKRTAETRRLNQATQRPSRFVQSQWNEIKVNQSEREPIKLDQTQSEAKTAGYNSEKDSIEADGMNFGRPRAVCTEHFWGHATWWTERAERAPPLAEVSSAWRRSRHRSVDAHPSSVASTWPRLSSVVCSFPFDSVFCSRRTSKQESHFPSASTVKTSGYSSSPVKKKQSKNLSSTPLKFGKNRVKPCWTYFSFIQSWLESVQSSKTLRGNAGKTHFLSVLKHDMTVYIFPGI